MSHPHEPRFIDANAKSFDAVKLYVDGPIPICPNGHTMRRLKVSNRPYIHFTTTPVWLCVNGQCEHYGIMLAVPLHQVDALDIGRMTDDEVKKEMGR